MAGAFNETRRTEVATEVRLAKSMWSRFWGLMGRRSLPERHGLLISPCASVHTFFMRIPIDVVFISRSGRVVKIIPAMKPWRTALGGSGAHSALELNAGEADGLVEVGDVLTLPLR